MSSLVTLSLSMFGDSMYGLSTLGDRNVGDK
jgi:hypothetical protein